MTQNELYHHGIKGQKWGIRRYQNSDGSLTALGKKKYGTKTNFEKVQAAKKAASKAKDQKARDKANARTQAEIEKYRNKANKKKGIKDEVEESKKESTKSKKLSDLTDDEVRAKTNRYNLERDYLNAQKQFNEANTKPPSKNKQLADKLLKDVVAPKAVDLGTKFIAKKLGLDDSAMNALKTEAEKAGYMKKIYDAKNAKYDYDKKTGNLNNNGNGNGNGSGNGNGNGNGSGNGNGNGSGGGSNGSGGSGSSFRNKFSNMFGNRSNNNANSGSNTNTSSNANSTNTSSNTNANTNSTTRTTSTSSTSSVNSGNFNTSNPTSVGGRTSGNSGNNTSSSIPTYSGTVEGKGTSTYKERDKFSTSDAVDGKFTEVHRESINSGRSYISGSNFKIDTSRGYYRIEYEDDVKHSNDDEFELYHHGIKGQKWGVRRFQKLDGTRIKSAANSARNTYDKLSVSKYTNYEGIRTGSANGRSKYTNVDGSLNEKGKMYRSKYVDKAIKKNDKYYQKYMDKYQRLADNSTNKKDKEAYLSMKADAEKTRKNVNEYIKIMNLDDIRKDDAYARQQLMKTAGVVAGAAGSVAGAAAFGVAGPTVQASMASGMNYIATNLNHDNLYNHAMAYANTDAGKTARNFVDTGIKTYADARGYFMGTYLNESLSNLEKAGVTDRISGMASETLNKTMNSANNKIASSTASATSAASSSSGLTPAQMSMLLKLATNM